MSTATPKKLSDYSLNDIVGSTGYFLAILLTIGVFVAIIAPMFLGQQKPEVESTIKSDVRSTIKSDVRNTVSNVALYAIDHPDGPFATVDTDLNPNITLVETAGNTIVIKDLFKTSRGDYTVTGTSAGVSGSYVFTASTGQYTSTLG